jgi:hypothetical protein
VSEGGLAPGVFHLVLAHELVWRWCIPPAYVALCGAQVDTASQLETRTECPNECGCEVPGRMACCPACLRAAIKLNHRAGVDVGDGCVVTAH